LQNLWLSCSHSWQVIAFVFQWWETSCLIIYTGHFLTYWKVLIPKEHNITQTVTHISRWPIVSSATLTKNCQYSTPYTLTTATIFGMLLFKPQVLRISIFIILGPIKQRKEDTLRILLWGDVLWTAKYLSTFRENRSSLRKEIFKLYNTLKI